MAKSYLEAKGYETLAVNYQIRGAELDLIMRHGIDHVFVEVKQRKRSDYGSAAQSISPKKLARMQQAALQYMQSHYNRDDLPMRFDAVLVEGDVTGYQVQHLEGIFF
ncbi:MAG: YraN family protein [Deinococcales bacterium]